MNTVIVGGGVGGLSTALAMARAGHEVTLLERDPLPATADAEQAFVAERRGAPQVHQTHGFLARIRIELQDRFPDVLDDLLAAGGWEMPTTVRLGDPQPGDDDLRVLIIRRTTFEWILRRAVVAETNVTIRTGTGVSGLVGDPAGGDPGTGAVPALVRGVRLEDGSTLDADLVVAAHGRRGPLHEWLEPLGVEVPETVRDSDLMYLTRWYHYDEGFELGDEPKLGGDLGFAKYLAVPGDGNTLSVTLAIRPGDTALRRALSSPEGFDHACRLLPGPQQFFEQGPLEPIGGVRPMTGLVNRIRRFTTDGSPSVLGFHAVGDAHTCTNPLYGRGCSLALVQALLLADAVADHPHDPTGRTLAYEAACGREIEPWFHLAVQTDEAGADPSGFAGAAPGSAAGEANPLSTVLIAAMSDPVLGRGFARMWNLLTTPAELMTDPALMARVAEVVAEPEAWPLPDREGPSRSELLELLGAAA